MNEWINEWMSYAYGSANTVHTFMYETMFVCVLIFQLNFLTILLLERCSFDFKEMTLDIVNNSFLQHAEDRFPTG